MFAKEVRVRRDFRHVHHPGCNRTRAVAASRGTLAFMTAGAVLPPSARSRMFRRLGPVSSAARYVANLSVNLHA